MTLSNLSDEIRLVIKWALVALIILFLLWVIWTLISGVSKIIFKPTGENIAYGTLAPPLFTKTLHKVQSETFVLDFESPKTSAEPKASVYKVVSSEAIGDKDLEKLVQHFGMAGEEKISSGNVSSWKHRNGSKLNINTNLTNITYRLNFSKEPSVLSETISSSEKDIMKKSELTLKSLNLLPDDIDNKKTSLKFVSIAKGTKKDSSKESANAVEISYFRKLDGKLTVGKAPIRILLSQNGDRILELDYSYVPINPVGSPYPILGSDQAIDLLKSGSAFSDKKKRFKTLKVKSLILSYWESTFRQPYLQPVWAFLLEETSASGNEEFTAYLPALDPSLLKSQD